ncbi:MAG TPA: adenylate/guanylate cyclase domain-containing protein [Casimicrobiaceae bacterium]|nr:adenylate/guanylate cyclase domain-containing protein [Casimicrobiaceae bacterium]
MADETPAAPESGTLERRLATILSADVAGYSRLMGENEEATVQALRGHRAVFDALLKQHHGRVFNTAGDAILAEFPSAVEAVRCATEIQSAIHTRNAHLPPQQKMLFRMGINLGDVVVQSGDLLGDGVNVAARIQTVADPGGICISGSVYDQIQNKLSLQFKPLGDQSFKNIGPRIRTFVITQAEAGALPSGMQRPGGKSAALIAGGAFLALALAAGGYWLYRQNEAKQLQEQESLSAQLAAQKQAAEEARRKAEELGQRAAEAESKAERERLVAEATKREATLQAQLQSAEEARRRAEADRKRIDEDRQRAEEARRSAEARAEAEKREAEQRAAQADAEKTKRTAVAAAGKTATAPGGATTGKFDGKYEGQFCNFPNNPDRKLCWKLVLSFQGGVAEATWPSRVKGKYSSGRFDIAPAGTVRVTLSGWNVQDESPLAGSLDGRIADNRIDVRGRWANGAPINGQWTRAE